MTLKNNVSRYGAVVNNSRNNLRGQRAHGHLEAQRSQIKVRAGLDQKDGKVVMTGTITVSKDGKSRVVKATTTDANGKKHTDKAYYDKQ
ncbi:MAG: hypothetical protein ABIU29_01405 [Chthoniobacterales bacterium]